MEKYYKILEIHTNATEQEVTQAYRDMVKVWHPDRFPNDIRLQKRADRKLKEINDAYQRIVEHLKNPHKQQQSQQYERTEKQEEQAGQPPPRQTKPNKSRRFYMKYWGLFLVIGSILLAKFMGHFMLGLVRNTGIFTDNQSNSGNQFSSDIIDPFKTTSPDYALSLPKKSKLGLIDDLSSTEKQFNRMREVTDVGILKQLNSSNTGLKEVTDPEILKQLGNPSEKLPSRSLFSDVGASIVQSVPKGVGIQITLRAKPTEGNLTVDAVKSMLRRYNFYCREYDWSKEYCNPKGAGIQNNYEKQRGYGVEVVVDHASGLMWQQSGSHESMGYENAKKYVGQLNHGKFAGYSDWRLPTLEEAMSLMEPTEMNGDLYIDPIFDRKQQWIWTSDWYSASCAWVVYFVNGSCDYYGVYSYDSYVRAVR